MLPWVLHTRQIGEPTEPFHDRIPFYYDGDELLGATAEVCRAVALVRSRPCMAVCRLTYSARGLCRDR